MHGAKTLFVVALIALAVAAGVFTLVPSTRPGFVEKWFRTASGFTPATSPEDALDKFKRALEKRDYKTAATYCSGEYKEFIEKGHEDAKGIADAVDNLRSVTKAHGVKSDQADLILFLLDPFPADFKIESVKKEGEEKATARLNWLLEVRKYVAEGDATKNLHWNINNRAWSSLLPVAVSVVPQLQVELKRGSDGSWTIVMPVYNGDRHMRDQVEFLRKNATNVRNGLDSLKTDVKNDPATREKQSYESSLRTKLESATK
jgi:hypothetical protein